MRLRIASFNLENLDAGGLAERLPVLRPQLRRLDADVLCLQEVDGQREGRGPRRLLALDRLLEGTDHAGFERASPGSTGRHAGGRGCWRSTGCSRARTMRASSAPRG